MAEENEVEKKKEKKDPWMYSTVAMVVLLFIISAAFLANSNPTGMATGDTAGGVFMSSSCLESEGVDRETMNSCVVTLSNPSGNALSADEAADNAIDFINSYMLQPGTTAELVDVTEEDYLYMITISISGQEYDTYVTKDGVMLFTSGIDITDLPETTDTTVPTTTKTDRPEAHAFIMSYCPYGLQFLKAYVPVIELLGDKADIEVNFVHYLMHGEQEMIENTRMYCIQKEQNDKFTDYLRCFVDSNDAAACIDSVGIDETSLDACMDETDQLYDITNTFEESESTYPPYPVDAVLAQQYGVGGSPTFVLNDVTLSVNRAAESVKQAICSAFNEPPAECDTVLSTETEAAGAGPIGSGGGSGSSATC